MGQWSNGRGDSEQRRRLVALRGSASHAVLAIAAAAFLAVPASAQITAGQNIQASTLSGSSTTLAGGTVTLDNTSSKDYSRDWTLNTVTSGANTIDIKGSTSIFSGKLTGSGDITFADTAATAGTLTITNSANTYTGATIISNGASVAMSGSGTIGTSSGLTVDGTFDITNSTSGVTITSLTGASTGKVTLGTVSLWVSSAVSGSNFAGVISGSGSFTMSAGSMTLSGINTFTGTTTVSAGTLYLSGAGSVATSSAMVVYGALDATAVTTPGGVSFKSLTGTGVVTLGSKDLTLTNSSGIFSGTLTTTGTLYVSGGTQWIGGLTTIGGANVASGATLQAGSTAVSYNVQNNGTFSFASNDVIAMTGVVSGSGAVTKLGTGVTTISTAQLYTGATTISGGTLQLSGAGSIAASSGVQVDSVFDLSSSPGASIKTLSGTGTVRLGTSALTITNGSAAGTFSGAITGTGTLTIASGTQVLSGANTYTGVTEVQNGGTLSLIVGASVRSAITVDSGATLKVADNLTTNGSVSVGSLGGAGNVTLGANTLTLTGANDTFSGVISGTGNVYITASSGGTERLAGDNTYTGTTTIAYGTLALTGRLATTSKLVVNGTFNATNAADATLKFLSLTGTGAVNLGSHGLEIDTPVGSTNNFGGVISGTGGLTVAGTGNEVLYGANTYTGGTTIASGATLQIGNGGITGSITGNVVDNGTLKFYRQDANTFANNILGTGGLLQAGVGTTKLTGTNTYTGVTTITNGTLQIGDYNAATNTGGTTGSIDATSGIVVNSNLAFARVGSVVINAPISGLGNVTILSGQVTFNQANTYQGITTIASGATLALTNTASITSSSSVAINGTLDISGLGTNASLKSLAGGSTGSVVLGNQTLTLTSAATNFAGTISGGGSLILTGGTQVLSGNSTGFTGTTTVSGGTLNVTGSLANSAVAVSGTGTVMGSGSIGSLTSTGTGTVRGVVGTTLTTGNINLATGSKVTVAMTSTHSANALVTTAGSAAVDGAVVSVASTDGTFDLGNQIKVLSAGTLTGNLTLSSTTANVANATFVGNTVGGNNAAVFRSTLAKTGGNYYLTVSLDQLTPALASTATLNQKHVVAGIDAAIAAGKVPPAGIQSLGNDTGAALLTNSTQVAGELGADTPLVARSLFNPFLDTMNAHTSLRRPIPKGGAPLQTWIAAYGGTDITQGDAGEGSSKFRSATDGVVLGAQWTPYANMLLGGAIAVGSSDFRVAGDLGKGTAKNLAAGVYGYFQMSRHFYNSFAAAVSGTQIKTTRVVTANGSDTLSAKLTAFSFGGRYEAGLVLPLVTPYAAIQDHISMMPGYGETAPAGHTDFALSYASRTYNSGRAELGLRNQFDISVTPRWILTPDFTLHLVDRLAYAYDLSDGTQGGASFANLPSSDFSVFGAKTGRHSALASVGAVVNFDNGLHVSTQLDTAFTKKSQAFTGSFTVGYTW